ncbi:DUF3263 domain-containing protein [Nocardia sp. 348MFTsu5.1]|uniref:DUF3263 domain-containing protein n=1 Tax=Nocardia sp. 348MFTsu5.1 TaxID=1172185 RepID=UPI0009DC361A|nr:DUF3263 domain-containing protein [Nocardia sp. 348MFTsu5.1]
MAPNAREMLDFEVQWYHLGGGPSEQIHERFGMSDRDYFASLNDLLRESPPEQLSPSAVERMRGVVRRRLWMAK